MPPVTKTRGWGSFECAMRKDDHFSKATSNKPYPHPESANGLAQTGIQMQVDLHIIRHASLYLHYYMFSHVTCYVSLGLNKFALIRFDLVIDIESGD